MGQIKPIVAMDLAGAIGFKGTIPWQGLLRDDIAFFKKTTTGHVALMGRKTWDSIPVRFRPLDNRKNVVLTRDKKWEAQGVEVIHDPAEIEKFSADQDVYIIGGAEIYKIYLPFADEILVTEIDHVFPRVDTFFPLIPEDWKRVILLAKIADDRNKFPFTISSYTRIVP